MPTRSLETDYLVVGAGAMGMAFTLAGSLRLSNRGRALLANQKKRHEALKAGTKWESSEVRARTSEGSVESCRRCSILWMATGVKRSSWPW